MEKTRKQDSARRRAWLLVFKGCSRSVSLYLYGVLEGERHGTVLLSSVRCLQRYTFTYFSPKKFS